MQEWHQSRIRPVHAPVPTHKGRLLHRKAYLKKAMIEALVNEILQALPDVSEAQDTPPVDLLALSSP